MTDRIRIDEPAYVARYRESGGRTPGPSPEGDAAEPSFLRRYRAEPAGGASVGVHTPDSPPRTIRSLPDDPAPSATVANDVVFVRHGELDQFSDDGGLTAAGVRQARSYGERFGSELSDGERVVVLHGGSTRTAQTADHIARGIEHVCDDRGRQIDIVGPDGHAAFANFRFVGPTGPVDMTEAFRSRHDGATDEWRVDPAAPPLWSFELDRFWNVQLGGGDPIELWLSIPALHAEPPAMVVRRMWRGIREVGERYPGARVVVATHSACVRAFAVAALGYDPGEPYNAEHVRAKMSAGRPTALVSYRNRNQEITVPDIGALPVWQLTETWRSPRRPAASATEAAS